jgi:hypothetical protein
MQSIPPFTFFRVFLLIISAGMNKHPALGVQDRMFKLYSIQKFHARGFCIDFISIWGSFANYEWSA